MHALGASRPRVWRTVAGRGLLLAGLGTAVGVAAAILLGPAAESLLFRVSAHDPLVFAGSAALALGIGAAASVAPAWRAASADIGTLLGTD